MWPDVAICPHFGYFWKALAALFLTKIAKKLGLVLWFIEMPKFWILTIQNSSFLALMYAIWVLKMVFDIDIWSLLTSLDVDNLEFEKWLCYCGHKCDDFFILTPGHTVTGHCWDFWVLTISMVLTIEISMVLTFDQLPDLEPFGLLFEPFGDQYFDLAIFKFGYFLGYFSIIIKKTLFKPSMGESRKMFVDYI